jgi:hypothetical protein
MAKKTRAVVLLCGCVVVGWVLSVFAQDHVFLRQQKRMLDEFGDDDKFLAMVQKYEELHRVTEKPFKMHPEIILRCTFEQTDKPHPFDSSVHADRYCDVYVSEGAKQPILSGDKSYPVGSIIIKAKYPNDQRERVELFTIMRKKEEGYFPEHGDWEFSVVDGKAQRVLSRGRSESCIDCHDFYGHSGFVSREYLKTQEERERL